MKRVYLATRISISITVTSACQGSRLACTWTVSIFRTITYMQTHFHHQNKPFCIGIEIKLFYQRTHLLIPRFMKSLCVITIKLNTLTDVPYQMTVCGAFVYVCENL